MNIVGNVWAASFLWHEGFGPTANKKTRELTMTNRVCFFLLVKI